LLTAFIKTQRILVGQDIKKEKLWGKMIFMSNDGGKENSKFDQGRAMIAVVTTLNQDIEAAKMSEDEALKGCQEVDHRKIVEVGEHFKEVYGAPEECTDRLEKYRAFVAPVKLFRRLAYMDMTQKLYTGVKDIAELRKDEIRWKYSIEFIQSTIDTAGITLTDKKRLLVEKTEKNEEEKRMRHEILHAMADFDDSKSGFQESEDSDSQNMNEAAVEILETADRVQKDPMALMAEIVDGKITFGGDREKYIIYTLLPLVLTQGTEEELSYKDLARYYWKGDAEGFAVEMAEKVEKVKGKVSEEKLALLRKANEVLESLD
jgi:hypothetical protein